MFNNNLYRALNPELKTLNNIQLLLHFKKNNNSNQIYSLESFFLRYPYFNHESYKLYNSDIDISEKIELMVHWHLIGINQNRICSDEYFNLLYPMFDINECNITDIYQCKNEYHKNYKNSLPKTYIEPLNPNKKNLLINVSNIENINFIFKSLSSINFHDINILIYSKNEKLIENINFLNFFILKEEDIDNIITLLNYIITDNLSFINILNKYNNLLKIFLPEDLINIEFIDSRMVFINNIFNNTYFKNNILITEYDKYIIKNDEIIKISKDKDIDNYLNKLYISQSFLENYKYTNLELDLKFINYEDTNNLNYGIVHFKNNYYIKMFDNYKLLDINYIKYNLPFDTEYVYVENEYSKIISNELSCNLKINIIFIINDENINYCYYNIQKILKSDYDNFNILILIKNNSNKFDEFKGDNIFINKQIVIDNNSLIIVIDNKYLIDEIFSLECINLLFITQKIFYINWLNLFIFKKELLYQYKGEKIYDLLSNDVISLLFNNIDSLLEIYKINKINYKYFEINNFKEANIKNTVYKFQLVIFVSENHDLDYVIKKINDFSNIDAQINIIHFNTKSFQLDNYNINYIFYDITNMHDKYKKNKSLAYNIIFDVFEKYLFEYSFLLFYNIESNIDYKLLNRFIYDKKDIFFTEIFDFIMVNKDLFEKIGGFDPEIFIDDSSYLFLYFLEKIKKYDTTHNTTHDTTHNTTINIKNNFVYNKFYDNIYEIIKRDNYNILLDFFNRKSLIDYDLFNKMKIVIINLKERKDRLTHIKKECMKIELNNYEIFNAIKIDNDNLYIKYSKLFNKNKLWKKSSEYFKSALGCKASHLEILKKYVEMDNDYIMILEDDTVFENNTLIYLNLALFSLKNIDWDILFLSSNLKNKDDATKIYPNLLKITKGLTTTAQIIKKKNIQKIINIIENSCVEIDNTYDQFIEEKYSVYPMCVYQEDFYSDINKKMANYGKFHKKFNF